MTQAPGSGPSNGPIMIVFAVLAAALCFAMCFAFLGGKPHASVPAAQGDTAGASASAETLAAADPKPDATSPAPPAAAAPTSAPASAAQPTSAPAPAQATINWTKIQPDCTVDLTDGIVHVQGTTGGQGWRFNGMQTTTTYTPADFTATVDFKCVKFTGPGNKTVYLRAGSRGGNFAGVYFNPEYYYQLHTWTTPQIHSDTHKVLGDEAANFHTLKLKYEAASKTTTAYVDDDPIGHVPMEFTGPVTFGLMANTNSAGMNVDVYFKNFKVEGTPTAP